MIKKTAIFITRTVRNWNSENRLSFVGADTGNTQPVLHSGDKPRRMVSGYNSSPRASELRHESCKDTDWQVPSCWASLALWSGFACCSYAHQTSYTAFPPPARLLFFFTAILTFLLKNSGQALTLLTCIRAPIRTLLSWMKFFVTSSLYTYIVYKIRPRPLFATSFPIHHSLIIPIVDAWDAEASLKTQLSNFWSHVLFHLHVFIALCFRISSSSCFPFIHLVDLVSLCFSSFDIRLSCFCSPFSMLRLFKCFSFDILGSVDRDCEELWEMTLYSLVNVYEPLYTASHLTSHYYSCFSLYVSIFFTPWPDTFLS